MKNRIKNIQDIKSYSKAVGVYFTYKPGNNKIEKQGKVLCLQIKRNYYSRYLYLFVKFFHLEGYRIYMKKSLRLVYQLTTDHYASFLFRERIINFGKPPETADVIRIGEDVISPDYFSENCNSNGFVDSFHVSMTQHPIMYHAGFWNAPIGEGKRKRSVFMAGNFDPGAYTAIEEDGIFDLMSRISAYRFLHEKEMLYAVENTNALAMFLQGADDHKIILINRLAFDIPMNELRSLLGMFDFYFALPGAVMPFSHNVVEAMSAGAIPFIQKTYANMFRPQLMDGVNVITFSGKSDLGDRLNSLFIMPQDKIDRMRQNVLEYYNKYLTPASLVRAMERSVFSKIYLQAEHVSVDLLKARTGR